VASIATSTATPAELNPLISQTPPLSSLEVSWSRPQRRAIAIASSSVI
jgi:hypothetical protein